MNKRTLIVKEAQGVMIQMRKKEKGNRGVKEFNALNNDKE